MLNCCITSAEDMPRRANVAFPVDSAIVTVVLVKRAREIQRFLFTMLPSAVNIISTYLPQHQGQKYD